MSEIAIRVDDLGKQYRIGSGNKRHDTLRDALASIARRPRSLVSRNGGQNHDDSTFWALKDISFEVKRGEVVGVIGRNGGGKSTLLKILSRITEPTTGQAEIHGRVGSLLEVGTGFHPELTGRENIYLNGAILGMKRVEIDRKFDEIVAFSEIERFLDMPVKRYSSGMYVRLAFAVAAHLEPEILLVDEVLAVGDAGFQKKCMGKMGDVAGEGRTVLFVSHNMAAVQNLTQQAILLREGNLALAADTHTVVSAYLTANRTAARGIFAPRHSIEMGGERARITGCTIVSGLPETGKPLELLLEIERDLHQAPLLAELSVTFATNEGARVLQANSADMDQSVTLGPGQTDILFTIGALPLVEGEYWLNLWLGGGDMIFHFLRECMALTVQPGSLCGERTVDDRGYPVVVSSSCQVVDRVGR